MKFSNITSGQNSTIKKIKKLSESSKFRNQENLVILDGFHLIQECINHGFKTNLQQVFVTEKFLESNDGKKFQNFYKKNQKYQISKF